MDILHPSNSRFFFKALTILLILVSLLISCTKDSNPAADTASERSAICGYDPVAYFEESKPIPGINDFSYVWNHAKWNFSSKENMELFKKDPEKYAPKYNGYCAFALSRNDFVETNSILPLTRKSKMPGSGIKETILPKLTGTGIYELTNKIIKEVSAVLIQPFKFIT